MTFYKNEWALIKKQQKGVTIRMSLTTLLGGMEMGLVLAIMAIGMYLSFKILNIPDLTVDGSFMLGSAVSAIFAANGLPWLGLLVSLLAGTAAGMITGFLQTKLKIQPILAGILTMTALYSVNLRIMSGKPNIPLFSKASMFNLFAVLPELLRKLVPILLFLAVVFVSLRLFLRTQIGMCIRATGDNESMVRASSINSDWMKILGLGLSNAIVALGGAVMAQYQSFADISGGIGMMVIGLASIIVGDAFCGKGGVTRGMVAAVLGAVVYRLILTVALWIGIASGDLKLLSALLVVIAISIPFIRKAIQNGKGRHANV